MLCGMTQGSANGALGELVIVGAGGQARIVKSIAERLGWVIVGVLDDDPERREAAGIRRSIGELAPDCHCGPLSDLANAHTRLRCVLAIGDNRARQQIDQQYPTICWATICHPTSVVEETASLGDGTVVCVAGIINPGAEVGRHVIVNSGAIVEHDVCVGSFCHIAPNVTLCGHVVVGEGTLIGAGSVVLPGRRVGAWSTIGAGSVVTKDVPDHTVAFGAPLRLIP